MMEIELGEKILQAHNEITEKNRELLSRHGLLTVNLMGSPGTGKTSVLEQLIPRLKAKVSMAVIEGDLYTSKDAVRIEAEEIPVVQINTRGGCHLDGRMIAEALEQLPLPQLELLIIENIGNLVCPAEFDLAEDLRVSMLSVTEGEDKIAKYPLMFQDVAAVILNKVDLIPYTSFDVTAFYEDLRLINPKAPVFEISCRLNTGIDEFADWCVSHIEQKRADRK
jgi:hydrogenase nickel incorporation protein HypB